MPFMYILECCDGTFYTGSTWNLEKRMIQHNEGFGAKYTAKRLPVRLVYREEFHRISKAFAREKQIQNWSHTKKKALIEGKLSDLHELSECKNETHCDNAHLDSSRLRSMQADRRA